VTDPTRTSLRCPRCAAPLSAPSDAEATCSRGHTWPVVAGILDCRTELTGFDAEADRRHAEELATRSEEPFPELLQSYWARTGLPPKLTERYVRGDLIGGERARQVVHQIREMTGGDLGSIVLEVGAGTAALGAALSPHVSWVVVTDVSLAWLVLARRRLQETGRTNWSLLAATADALPFRDDAFDLIVAADVIEHVPDPEAMIDEGVRLLRPEATLWLSTPNRFSLTPEPHVRVWGVGLLPRRLAPTYVRLVRGVPYEDIRTLSYLGLRRLTKRPETTTSIQAPRIPDAVVSTYSRWARLLIRLYHLAIRAPVLNRVLLVVSPLFHVTVTRRGVPEPPDLPTAR